MNKDTKVLPNLDAAISACGLKDGMTVSFHHHLRNGDYVLNAVLERCAALGIKDLTVAASSIFPAHAPLVEHIRNGVVTGLVTSYATGPVAQAISKGLLAKPVRFQTHGGRARAIEAGEVKIDVAFIAAPTADEGGNINGVQGQSACGSLGYAFADAFHASKVVAVTDNLMPYPIRPISIQGTLVDYVVKVDRIGDPSLIVSGTTRVTRDPLSLSIAETASRVIEASGLLKDGISFQTGAGGVSLAVAHFVRHRMEQMSVQGSFGLGGITGYFVDMLKQGLFRTLLDVQCFDLDSVQSLGSNPNHQEISASLYANPWAKSPVVDFLDVVVLGATEIDQDFNVNVLTSSDGLIMGGSGGHSDTAAGSKLTMIVCKSTRTRVPVVRHKVTCVTTPGDTVDVLVTERGVTVNPRRQDLLEQLKASKVKVVDMETLLAQVEACTGRPAPVAFGDRTVGLVEYRDGTVIDQVKQVI